MKSLLTWLCVVGSSIGMSASAERGLISADPLIQQAKLTAEDAATLDCFGWSVALNNDGDTAIAGAFYADVDGNANQGAAYVLAALLPPTGITATYDYDGDGKADLAVYNDGYWSIYSLANGIILNNGGAWGGPG